MARRSVLIPLDGSAFSRSVLAEAKKLFHPGFYTLTLLHVAPPLESLDPHDRRKDDWKLLAGWSTVLKETERGFDNSEPVYLDQYLAQQRARFIASLNEDRRGLEDAGFKVFTEVRFGDVCGEIEAFIKDHQINTVMMATHGKSGVKSVLMGTVTETLLRRLHLPIVMLRPDHDLLSSTLR